MRRLIFVVGGLCLLTGCSGSHNLTEDLENDLGWIVEETPPGVPADAYAGGQVFFGDGREKDEDDIFTVIENKIWGEDEE